MTKKIHEVSIKIIADGEEVSCYDTAIEEGFDPSLLKTIALGMMETFKMIALGKADAVYKFLKRIDEGDPIS